jgi:hypothetical protein
MPWKTFPRQILYRSEKLIQRMRFNKPPVPASDWPALLGISFPKSGTHLLDQILLGFAKVAPFSLRLHSFFAGYEGESGRKRTLHETLAWVDSLRPLDIASAHLFAWDRVVTRVAAPDFVSYFIFRDPRDVVVSHVFYVTDMEAHHVHHEYYKLLADFNSRLKTSILGRPDADVEFPDIAGRFAPYMGWLDQPAVMPLHFEDLVNARPEALDRIIEHFLRRVPLHTPRERIREALEASINPQRSPTFRSGRTGEWKQHFTPEHKLLFKEAAGDLLVRLGYEKNNDW